MILSRTAQYRLEERINIGGEDDPRELLQLIQSDPALYKDMLLQDYRRFPELTWAKQRAALALGKWPGAASCAANVINPGGYLFCVCCCCLILLLLFRRLVPTMWR